jgi:hypothetical protein
VNYLGRGSDGRTPMYSQTDIYVQHAFTMGGRSLQVSFNVLNLLNQDTAVSRFSTYQQGNNSVTPDETLFYTGKTDAGIADPHAGREGSALPDGQRVSRRRSPRASASSSCSKDRFATPDAPRAPARGAFLFSLLRRFATKQKLSAAVTASRPSNWYQSFKFLYA